MLTILFFIFCTFCVIVCLAEFFFMENYAVGCILENVVGVARSLLILVFVIKKREKMKLFFSCDDYI